jgi:hypothetical protein
VSFVDPNVTVQSADVTYGVLGNTVPNCRALDEAQPAALKLVELVTCSVTVTDELADRAVEANTVQASMAMATTTAVHGLFACASMIRPYRQIFGRS